MNANSSKSSVGVHFLLLDKLEFDYGNQNNKSMAQIRVFLNLSLVLHSLINDPENR